MFQRAYVEITNICNLRCSFCPGTVRQGGFLSLDAFRTIAERLRQYTGFLYLHVMGEPLLHPQLPQIIALAGELGYRVCVTTNGTLLHEAGDVLHHPCIHKVSVSLHSFEGNNGGDIVPYLTQVWQFCEGASSLVALRLWNEGGLNSRNGDILRFLSEKTGLDVERLPVDGNGSRKLADRLFLESAERFDWPSLSAEERPVEFCHGLRRQIAVLCDGTVVPCCLDAEGSIALGNLLEEDMEKILSSERVKALREGFSRRSPTEELCRRCGYATRFSL